MTIRLPHETTDFLRVPVTINGEPATAYEISIVTGRDRPTEDTWVAATTDDDGHTGIIITGLPAGQHDVYVRIDADPVTPVRFVESFVLE